MPRLVHLARRSLALTSLALLIAAVPATAAGNGDKGAKAKAKAKAAAKDRNHDRIPDRWERAHGLSLKLNQAKRDQDRDGVRNRSEYLARTDPRDADTDDDGVRDGKEGAGRIEAFAGSKLKVRLFNGDLVTARVDGETGIECYTATELEREAAQDEPKKASGARARAASGEDEGFSEQDESPEPGTEEDLEGGELEDEESGHEGSEGAELEDERYGDAFGDEDPHLCSDDELKAGRVVHEAELRATPAGLAWRELVLVV